MQYRPSDKNVRLKWIPCDHSFGTVKIISGCSCDQNDICVAISSGRFAKSADREYCTFRLVRSDQENIHIAINGKMLVSVIENNDLSSQLDRSFCSTHPLFVAHDDHICQLLRIQLCFVTACIGIGECRHAIRDDEQTFGLPLITAHDDRHPLITMIAKKLN